MLSFLLLVKVVTAIIVDNKHSFSWHNEPTVIVQ